MKSQIVLTANGPGKFYKFENEEDFSKWEQKIFGEWAEQYNKKVEDYQKKQEEFYFDKTKINQDLYFAAACIEMYCGDEHKNINGLLRGEPYFCEETARRISILHRYIVELDKCFWTAPVTDKNLICYRSMDEKETEFYKHNTSISKYLSISGTLKSLSNSFDTKTAYTIFVPAGTRILCPNMIKSVVWGKTLERHEAELILPRGMTIKKKFWNYNLVNTQYT